MMCAMINNVMVMNMIMIMMTYHQALCRCSEWPPKAATLTCCLCMGLLCGEYLSLNAKGYLSFDDTGTELSLLAAAAAQNEELRSVRVFDDVRQ